MKKLKIKTFMIDSRRPDWLLMLLQYVNTWFPFDKLDTMINGEAISWIESALPEIPCYSRKAKYKLTQCVNYYIDGEKLTIRTVYKGRPMVEFSIVEEGGTENE